MAADYAKSQNVALNRVITIRHESEVFYDSLPGVHIQSHSNRLALDTVAPLKGAVFIRLKLSGPVSAGSLLGSYNTPGKASLLKFVPCDQANLLAFLPADARDIVIPTLAEILSIDAFVPNLPLND